jgi:plastocyanin
MGRRDYAANIYTPNRIQIYAGDTVTWRNNSLLEPHTISFGPAKLLAQLARDLVTAVPQRTGPPQLSLNPQAAFPTRSTTYDGSGYANSGLLNKGQSWSLTFTKPGVYRHYCLVHYLGMAGTVVVRPRPTRAHLYLVQSGYGTDRSYADAFFPDHLRIHVGDTVEWSSGAATSRWRSTLGASARSPPRLLSLGGWPTQAHLWLPVPARAVSGIHSTARAGVRLAQVVGAGAGERCAV